METKEVARAVILVAIAVALSWVFIPVGIAKCYPKTAICRMSLMFGISLPGRSNYFQQLIASMRSGQPTPLFIDEYRTMLPVTSAVSGLLLALEGVQGTLHLGGNERISRFHFAQLVAQILQIKSATFSPCTSKDLPMAAPRPPDLSLDTSKAQALGFTSLSLEQALRELKVYDTI